MRTSNKYDEILSLPHHISKTLPQMPMSDSAARFSPFAALNGYDTAIKETGRLTDTKIESDGFRALSGLTSLTKLHNLKPHKHKLLPPAVPCAECARIAPVFRKAEFAV